MQAQNPILSIEKKQGKNTYGAVYNIKDEGAALSWTNKPFKVRLGGQQMVPPGKALSNLMLSHSSRASAGGAEGQGRRIWREGRDCCPDRDPRVPVLEQRHCAFPCPPVGGTHSTNH